VLHRLAADISPVVHAIPGNVPYCPINTVERLTEVRRPSSHPEDAAAIGHQWPLGAGGSRVKDGYFRLLSRIIDAADRLPALIGFGLTTRRHDDADHGIVQPAARLTVQRAFGNR
jgi:hypothetical protein